ncbi:MAG: hypothetical protein C3F08_04540 [Candidatus Methylomirabilota bacterium]|nr:MAG: hypothetical protein C3F08_04540 [candidate division NC10 bacterium]
MTESTPGKFSDGDFHVDGSTEWKWEMVATRAGGKREESLPGGSGEALFLSPLDPMRVLEAVGCQTTEQR